MIAPTKKMPAHMGRVMTPSLRARGGFVITSASAGSTPSANAGAPSVTRLIHSICVASSGRATPPLVSFVRPIVSPSTTPKNIVITSPIFDESR